MDNHVKIEVILLLDRQIGILCARLLVYMYIDFLANFVTSLGTLYLYNVYNTHALEGHLT